MSTITVGRSKMNRKIISVSNKRQITIPLKFFKLLGLDHENEVECTLEDDAIVIRPLNNKNNDFSIEILKDLISQGYSGDSLVKQFEEKSKDIKKAITTMIDEADKIAAGEKSASSFNDIFGTED